VTRGEWRPHRRAAIGIAAGLAAFAATAVLALTQNGAAGSSRPGSLGPEGVPIPRGRALAPPRRLLAVGERIDGVACQLREQVLFHIHAHLTVFVRGLARQVPAGIGIAPPYEAASTPQGVFVTGAPCFMWLHTHAADGIIHTESPVQRTYTLGEFFDIWGQPLNRNRVGPAHGHVTALLNRRLFTGDPRQIPLLGHAQIQLDVGRPLVSPERITFPQGL
jgi:hypothetical protein